MDSELRNMVMAFRVTELQCLLGFAGRNKTGRKNELQARALELVKHKHTHIVTKIKELYRSIQLSMNQPLPASSNPGIYLTSGNSLYPGTSGYVGAQEKALQGRSAYSGFNTVVQGKSTNMALISMPICPDVKLKRLPFFETQSELIKPTSLISAGPVRMQEGTFPFCLTPQQAADVAASKELLGGSLYSSDQKIGYQMQVQLRFCLLDTSGEQDDNFPPSICVRVNGKIVPLPHPIPSTRPAVEPKRPSKPLNITNYVKLSPTCTNTVGITWVSDGMGRGWVMSLFLVKKLSAVDLLAKLKSKGVRPSEFTTGMIKEIVMKDDGDCQIAMTSLKVSVACPLGKCRMTLPCRASTCAHLQCFDASLFLQMNEKKPTWTCVICDKKIAFENLSIDGYFQDVINSLPFQAGNDVEVLPDGTWRPIAVKKEAEEGLPAKRLKLDVQLNGTICLDDDLLIDDTPPGSQAGQRSDGGGNKVVDMVDLTLSDSDDEDFAPILPRRRVRPLDETSSSSSSSDSSSSSSSTSETTKNSTITTAAPTRTLSPTVITLDSPSPSPEPSPEGHVSTAGGVTNFQINSRNYLGAPSTNRSGVTATASGSSNLNTLQSQPTTSESNNMVRQSHGVSTTTGAPLPGRRNPSPSLLSNLYPNQTDAGYHFPQNWDDGFP